MRPGTHVFVVAVFVAGTGSGGGIFVVDTALTYANVVSPPAHQFATIPPPPPARAAMVAAMSRVRGVQTR